MAARRRYIDWLRGLAVLIMLEAHTFDAWTAPIDRTTLAFRDLIILGGFGAPLFLFLAGVALVLSAERLARRVAWRPAVSSMCRRGLEIFILAFLFRVQAFVVSPGSSPIALFRVDILNVMGPSMAIAGLMWGLSRNRLVLVLAYAALTTAIAMVTPIVRAAAWVGTLPVWVQWYLRPAGEHTTFTLLPWAAFVFVGGAAGVLIAATGTRRDEHRLMSIFAVTGSALVALGFGASTLPSIYANASFWTSSPTYFAIRAGLMIASLSGVYGLAELAARLGISGRLLDRLGRNSLFVYWIHVELVYGYASWPLHHHLRIWETTIAYVAFTSVIYGVVALRDRFVARWRSKGTTASALLSNP